MKILSGTLLLSALSFWPLSCTLPSEDAGWSVMSWNVQNLFDSIDAGNEYPEFDPGLGVWDQRLYERRLARLGDVCAEAIRGSADLLVFQELETPEILIDLLEGPLKGRGYTQSICLPGYGNIRCGILSRFPLHSVRAVDCGSYGGRSLRPALSFYVEAPGGSVRVIACHWKSPWNGRAATESARRREALIVKNLALEVLESNPAGLVLIIGDLNTSGDGELRPAALAAWEPGLPIDGDPVLFRTPEAVGAGLWDGEPVFFDPEPDSTTGERGTYWYRDAWDRPDRALLSQGFLNGRGLTFTACRAGADVMEDSEGHPVPWVTEWEEGFSDHLPLVLEFSAAQE